MKYLNQTVLFLLFCTIPYFANSQQKISETTESIGDLKGNALTIDILRADEKSIQKKWKSIMKSYEGKVKTKGDKIYTSDAKIESISSGNVQINAEIGNEKNGKREFTVIFQSERGAVSSGSDISGYTAAKNIVENFAKDLSLDASNEYKSIQEGALTKLQKEKAHLEKENKNLPHYLDGAIYNCKKSQNPCAQIFSGQFHHALNKVVYEESQRYEMGEKLKNKIKLNFAMIA